MNIQIKNSSKDPIYLQIKNQIKLAILNGELGENEPLPSIRELAKELRVSVITTKRAYDDLESDGFIHSVQGKGSFVAPQNKELLRESVLKKIEENLLKSINYAKIIDLSREELISMLDNLEDLNE